MKPLTIVGVILVVLGIAALVVQYVPVTERRTLVDAGVSYAVDKHLTLSVNATNLFDKEYLATCSDLSDCYPGSRRSVIGRVKYQF